jgi:ADP-ribose pyrophosphatase YjhB (NUDIX family)
VNTNNDFVDESWYIKPPGVREDISAGGVVMRMEAGRCLVALVAQDALSHYFLPKGRCKAGENLQIAARREIKEEAGISDLTYIEKLGIYERLNYTKKSWKVIHYFLFQTEQVEGVPTDTKHAYSCEWFPLDALPPLLWPEQIEVMEKLALKYLHR